MVLQILIINGPNLNIIGKRQPEYYGHMNFDDFLATLNKKYKKVNVSYKQSNREGDIINFLQEADGQADGIILNAGAYTHTSIAIADAIQSITVPVIEVHISNIYGRESFRQISYLAPYCKGVITGFGLTSYQLALEYFILQGNSDY
jgi:3-dehydroquinate dehydratase II